MSKKIAFIGIGLMGLPMSKNILKAGYNLKVFNRSKNKAEPLKEFGAEISSSIKDVVKDSDVVKICANKKILTNLEISLNNKILKIALKNKPNFICLVPENRKEITTEGGLNLFKNKNKIKSVIKEFDKKKIRTRLFIDPKVKDIKMAKELNVDCIELHTGKISNLVKQKKSFIFELNKIKKICKYANKIGLEVHAGHGLDYKTTKILSKVKEIKEFNIGHFIIGESITYGIKKTIKKFKKISN